jgi:hypothetical protein
LPSICMKWDSLPVLYGISCYQIVFILVFPVILFFITGISQVLETRLAFYIAHGFCCLQFWCLWRVYLSQLSQILRLYHLYVLF